MNDELKNLREENDILLDELAWYKAKANRLEREKENHKAKAFDELKKHVDEEGESYMVLYRETKDPAYSLLNSHYDTLLGYMEELERADDER